jgi:hypothetical protein
MASLDGEQAKEHNPRMAWLGAPAVFVVCIVTAIANTAALARDEARPFAAAVGNTIESCVDSSAIVFGAQERRAILDAEDTATVGEALLKRYPAFAQVGLAPQGIVLWRKPETEWLYITLLINPEKAGELCFTATFVAAKVAITPLMLKKYFGVET